MANAAYPPKSPLRPSDDWDATNPNTPRTPTRDPDVVARDPDAVAPDGAATVELASIVDTASPPKSPPRLSDRWDTTNPNTLTPARDPGAVAPENAATVEPASMVDTASLPTSPPRPSDEPPRGHDAQLSSPKCIDIAWSPAVATWQDLGLPGISLDMHWHVATNKGFFRLRADASIKHGSGLPPSRRGKTSIYLFIHPERIRQLSVDTEPADKKLGANTLVLSFNLMRPAILVLPKPPYEPKNDVTKDLIEAFQKLASQSSFLIHTGIPRRKLSAALIRKLCEAASGGKMASLAAHASTASLYRGQGGQAIEGESLAPPPAYAELPPVTASKCQAKKRRRRSSGSEPDEIMDRKAFKELLDMGMSSLKTHFDDRLTAHTERVTRILDQTEARILETVKKEIKDQRIDMLQDINTKIRQEMADVGKAVMRNIRQTTVEATLTFPTNPW